MKLTAYSLHPADADADGVILELIGSTPSSHILKPDFSMFDKILSSVP